MRDGDAWIGSGDTWEGAGTGEGGVNGGGSGGMYRGAVTRRCGRARMSRGWGHVGRSLVIETTKVDVRSRNEKGRGNEGWVVEEEEV